ncbi:DUF4393 domain-containing protein [Bacillus subtilis]|uniref:DUF4393 domain-containing protein n=1 Tax=Bacillus subtilis TaxID=1423 RepID=UPI001BAE3DFB|nr:DUF4393 domain-containing protein [Bacillus subtilis]MDP0481816.1 DUF4393 domain-containing protein [Bacillus subtilis]
MKIDLTPKFIDEATTPLAKSVGKTLDSLWSLVFGGIDFYVDKVNTKRVHSLQLFKEELETKVSSIPEESLTEPPLHIIGPTIEASKFYFENDELRSMFANLIAASFDAKTLNKTHPAFIELIKQLSPLDAKNLKIFKSGNTYPIVKYNLMTENNSSFTEKDNVFLDNDEVLNIDLNSTSITNLNRLGLLEITYGTTLVRAGAYDKFYNEPFFKSLKDIFKNGKHKEDQTLSGFIDIDLKKGVILLTPFGSNFIDICL